MTFERPVERDERGEAFLYVPATFRNYRIPLSYINSCAGMVLFLGRWGPVQLRKEVWDPVASDCFSTCSAQVCAIPAGVTATVQQLLAEGDDTAFFGLVYLAIC